MYFDGLFFRADALAHGYTDGMLRRGRLSGELIAVRPGAYVSAEYYRTLDSEEQHLLLARAMGDDLVLSHVTAAIAWGLDVWGLPLARVHTTNGRPITAKRLRRRTMHGTSLRPDESTTHNGLTLTTPARTVIDIARTWGYVPAVCVGDSALRRRLVTAKSLVDALSTAKFRSGVPDATRAVEAMSDRSESVGESRSRLLLTEFPGVLVNQSVYDEQGAFLGRVDFLFPDCGVVGEFDGAAKYGESPADVRARLLAEKYREDRLRDAGWVVVRWGWADLADPDALLLRIRRALRRGAQLPVPCGTFRADLLS